MRQGMLPGFLSTAERSDEQWAAIKPEMLLHTAVTESREFLAYNNALRSHAKTLEAAAYNVHGKELDVHGHDSSATRS